MSEDLNKTSTSNFDVIMLTYDEPNAEENWADLSNKIPWAKRVHGVKGFDEAHKECARQSETDNFITVDGDNKVDSSFFDQEIEFNPNWVYSWGAKNHINGLIYGNGGLKLWPKHLVMNMKTHEKTNEGIEFCWDLPYYQMNDWYSISYNDATPFQAFRVGFREGVKMSLHEGKKVSDLKLLWYGNIKRLMIWMTVGADITNGIYSIYGARLGFYESFLTNFDLKLVSDYDWFNDMWHNTWMPLVEDEEQFTFEYKRLCTEIQNTGLPIANLGKKQSEFFKATLVNPNRMGLTVPERAGEEYMIKNNFVEKRI